MLALQRSRVLERRRAVALARHCPRVRSSRSARSSTVSLARDGQGACFYDRTGEKAKAIRARYEGGCGAYTQPRNGKGDAYAWVEVTAPVGLAAVGPTNTDQLADQLGAGRSAIGPPAPALAGLAIWGSVTGPGRRPSGEPRRHGRGRTRASAVDQNRGAPRRAHPRARIPRSASCRGAGRSRRRRRAARSARAAWRSTARRVARPAGPPDGRARRVVSARSGTDVAVAAEVLVVIPLWG